MTRSSPAQLAFSSGELSPLLHRRYDYQRYQTGMRTCRGFIPLRQGGFTRAPGTIDRGNVYADQPARLVNFEFAENDALTIEFTDLRLRIWRYGQLVMNGAVPYELATPFPPSSLPLLQWVQAADVIWITDGLRPVQKLSRLALNNWTIAPANFIGGPFRVQNLNTNLSVQASAATGVVTLTATAPIFDASHTGSLFQLKAVDTLVPLWTGNTAASVGQKMRYDGKTYVLTVGTNTGVNPPTHSEGEQRVSLNPDVRWRYLDDGVGIVQILTGITPGVVVNHAQAQVIRQLPDGVVTSGTYRWSEAAWSSRYGYPSLLEIHEQRLIAAATPSEPRTVWFSTAGAFEDFTPGTLADSAFAYAISGASSINRIIWLKRGKTGLHIGALGEEYSTRADSRGQALGPTTANFGMDSSLGGRPNLRPVAPDGRPIFVSKDTRRIFEIAYSFQEDANVPTELSLPADHMGEAGFAELAWLSAPQRTVVARRGDGDLALVIYDPTQEVLGWARLPLAGGFVEAMSVTPDATGTRDVLTMVVRRTIGGVTVRRIEELAEPFGLMSGLQPITAAIHLYSARQFAPATPQTVFSVPHLAGQTVTAWTDHGEFDDLTVAPGGNVTLPVAVSVAVIGLFDATHQAETLDLLGAAPDGSTIGRQRRLSPKVRIGVHRTAAGRVQAVERETAQAERAGGGLNLIPRGVAADLTAAYSGMVRLDLTSGMAQEISLRFTPVGGAPMTITALSAPITEAGQ